MLRAHTECKSVSAGDMTAQLATAAVFTNGMWRCYVSLQVGADVRAWFADMPRITRLLPQKRPATSLGLPPPSGAPLPFDPRLPPLAPLGGPFATGPGAAPLLGSRTIDQFYLSRHCAVCDALTRVNAPLCEECSADPQTSLAILQVCHGCNHAYCVCVCVCVCHRPFFSA